MKKKRREVRGKANVEARKRVKGKSQHERKERRKLHTYYTKTLLDGPQFSFFCMPMLASPLCKSVHWLRWREQSGGVMYAPVLEARRPRYVYTCNVELYQCANKWMGKTRRLRDSNVCT